VPQRERRQLRGDVVLGEVAPVERSGRAEREQKAEGGVHTAMVPVRSPAGLTAGRVSARTESVSRRRVLLVLAPCLAAVVLPASAPGDGFASFRLPSKRIGCMYGAVGTAKPSIRCDVLGAGLHPRPTAKCPGDWVGVTLSARGKARPVCAGDTAVDPKSPILAYGKTWKRGAITCRSATDGLRCSSMSGHGFFLARESWRVH